MIHTKIQAIEPKEWKYLGELEVISKVDRCKTCMWYCAKEYELIGLQKERWAEMMCGLHKIEGVDPDDYCSWWERV